MKKILCVAFAIVSLGFVPKESTAQGKSFYSTPYKDRNSGSFEKGASIFSIGYGVGSYNHLGYNWFGYKRMTIGPVYLKYEMGVMDEVSIGGYIAPEFTTRKYNSSPYSNAFGLGVGIMGYYHFNKFIPVKKLDVYAGVGFGIKYYKETYKDNTITTDSKIYPRPIVKVGVRYYFTDSFGAYAESGYDNSSDFNIGVSFKF